MSSSARPPRRRRLRVRVTLAFASVVATVLLAASALVFVQFRGALNARVDEELVDRTVLFRTLTRDRPLAGQLGPTGETFAQIFTSGGRVIGWSRRLGPTPVISPGLARRGRTRGVLITIPTFREDDAGARLRVFPMRGGHIGAIVEPRAGQQADLRRLALLLAITMPAALLLASLGGYRVAGLALRPVDEMRRRARQIGAGDLSERLPAPHTGDELERLADTLNDLLARIEEGMVRERRMVSDASHELRTPISVLRTRAEVALRGPDDQLRHALAGIVTDAERLSRLADDLLVLARADQGQLPLTRDPVDAWDLATGAATRASAAGIDLEVRDETDGGAVVLGDEQRLEQALDNLIANAARYGAPPIVLTLSRVDSGTTFAVRDHGPGVPDVFLPRAFDRFSQADTSHQGAGSGLGLAIVAAIAGAHGGRASLRNADGPGTLAELWLPDA